MKKTRITIETESVQIVYRGRTSVAWCAGCCAEVDTITLTGNSVGEQIPPVLFQGLLATGKLHCRGPDTGPVEICLNSLLRCFASEDAAGEPNPK